MTPRKLNEGIIIRMSAWGLIGGAVSGFAYGGLVVWLSSGISYGFLVPLGFIVGLAVGAISGLGLGILDGVALVFVTRSAFRRVQSVNRYRTTMLVVSITLVTLGTYLGFGSMGGVISNYWLSHPYMPSVLAAIVASLATLRVADWVQHNLSFSTIQTP